MSAQADPQTTVYWCVNCGPVLRLLMADGGSQTLHRLPEAQHTFPVALVDDEDFPRQ